jgi:4-hydroxythreonine-4-phosphate dehydrogenase
MDGQRPVLGLTMGDPAGIGPEIVLKAARLIAEDPAAPACALVVIGSAACLAAAAERLGLAATLRADGQPQAWPALGLVEAAAARRPIQPGQLDAEAGRLAFAAIERAVELAMAGRIDAIVTAPISKEALHLAGYPYPGHTEILAALSGSRDSCMLLVHDRLRVSHVSTHVALAEVPRRVTPARLRRVIELTIAALADLGIARPRLGVCALNPHAGEGGLFGTEDQAVIAPVVEACRAAGLAVEGPLPADTIYVKALAGRFDGVVAMYHDQGHIPLKLLGFTLDPASGAMSALSGVNVTLGLPIIRTSVDHGTAFDIAGQGIANPQSLLEAIALAARLAAGRAARAPDTGAA